SAPTSGRRGAWLGRRTRPESGRPTASVDPSAAAGREPDLDTAIAANDRGHDPAVVCIAHELRSPVGIHGGVALLDRFPLGGQVLASGLAVGAAGLDVHDHAHGA